ncbi:hypothetical protein [Actinomadura sp. 9N407]|uniref:hypothetical protein n=1 Tax=Actinomadura sp. 9N407 TaxID=3375154 RepID=UPI0037B0EA48
MSRRRADRLVRWSARPWENRWASRFSLRAWITLVKASEHDDHARAALLRLATGDEHRTHFWREDTRDLVAEVWAKERDHAFRAVVLEHGLIPKHGKERWTAAALNGRLLECWAPDAGPAVAELLDDDDEDVRTGAVRACGEAAEPVLGNLWQALASAAAGPGSDALLRELLRNPRPLEPDTLGFAWRHWLNDPGDPLWEFLRAIGRPAPTAGEGVVRRLSLLALGSAAPADLCRAVISERTPDAVRRIVIATCVERGLQPSDPAERVIFLLLTGQSARSREADPDGALLAAAYAKAPAGLRSRLNAAVAVAEEPDLVRVLLGTAERRAMSVEERGLLAGGLAAGGAWPELWRLARDLPLVEAIAAVHLIEEWRPSGDAGAVFDRLRRMEPEPAVAALESLNRRDPIRLNTGLEQIEGCALSPDGSRLAVFGHSVPGGRMCHHLIEFALPEGRVVATYEGGRGGVGDSSWREAVHTGDDIIAIAGSTTGSLVRYAGGERERFYDFDLGGQVGAVRLAPNGVVATSFGGVHLFSPPYGVPSHGVPSHSGPAFHARTEDLGLKRPWAFSFAVEPESGLIAIGDRDLAVLDAGAGRVLARTHGLPRTHRGGTTDFRMFAFASPHRIITVDDSYRVAAWRLDGASLTLERTAPFRFPVLGRWITALPANDRIAVCEGRPVYLDPSTLERTDPPVVGKLDAHHIWSTPSGEHVAFGDRTCIEVHGPYLDPAGLLLQRPLAGTVPEDLAAIGELIASERYGGDVAELLTLFRICLGERHGEQVTLGRGGATEAAGAD